MWDHETIMMIVQGVGETLYMTVLSTVLGYLFGLPMGVLLAVSDKEGLKPNAVLYKILDAIANIVRSIPFLILLILLIPFTRAVVGKSYGSTATVVPLVVAAIPFIARTGIPELWKELSCKEGLKPNAVLYKILDAIANIVRSIPFLILLILLIPFTRAVVGKSYGSTATVVPLVVAAIPFIARMVESSIKEVDAGVIEAARAMGASNMRIIVKVLLVEARTSLITGATIAIGTILGYSAMSGAVGGGGLGDIAIRYGYYRYQSDIMIITVILLVVLVQIFQSVGMMIANKIDRRK